MKRKRNVIKRNSGFIVGCLLAAGASYFAADTAMTQGLASFLIPAQDAESETDGQAGNVQTLAPETDPERVFETDPFTVTASGNIIKGVETEAQTIAMSERAEDGAEQDGEDGEDGEDGSSGDDGSYDDGSGSGSGDDGSYDDGSGSGSYGDGSYDDGSGSGSYGDGSYGDGSGSGSYSDGFYDDGSGSGSYDGWYDENGNYYDGSSTGNIEIQDPGNGDYYYDDGSGSGGSGGGSSGGSGSGDGVYSEDGTAWTPSDVIIQGISSRYIDESELYNYTAGQLRLIRNEIFALNGRIFNSQDLRDYFSQKSWYVPTYAPEDFDADMFYYLNDYEEANLQVILDYEAALAGN